MISREEEESLPRLVRAYKKRSGRLSCGGSSSLCGEAIHLNGSNNAAIQNYTVWETTRACVPPRVA